MEEVHYTEEENMWIGPAAVSVNVLLCFFLVDVPAKHFPYNPYN